MCFICGQKVIFMSDDNVHKLYIIIAYQLFQVGVHFNNMINRRFNLNQRHVLLLLFILHLA